MNPLLRENDLLEVAPCGPQSLNAGDVIAYEKPCSGLIVVHRVVAVGVQGLLTRGDNNGSRDTDPVLADQLIGRVSVGWRGSTRFGIAGGRRGLLTARILWLRRACGKVFERLLGVPQETSHPLDTAGGICRRQAIVDGDVS